jgi:cytochrome P450
MFPRSQHAKYGDTFVVATPAGCSIRTRNAELINQITNRRNDFVKPTSLYRVLDLFGSNILSTEGAEWKKHKKIVGPSFSERSNKLVFQESLRQAECMVAYWASLDDNTIDDMRIEDPSVDIATLSLHVICAAGFGVPQLWSGQDDSQTKGSFTSGLTSSKPVGSHLLTFKEALVNLLHGLLYFAFFTSWQLSKSPYLRLNISVC